MLIVAQVVGQLSIQRTLNQLLGQLLEDAVSTDQVFRIPVFGQEPIQQLVGDGMLRLAHGVSGSARQCRSLAGYTKIRTPSSPGFRLEHPELQRPHLTPHVTDCHLDDTGADEETFTLDQTCRHAAPH